MESLSNIIVKKYIPNFENFKPTNLVTDNEYKIVKSCHLNDLLDSQNNPAKLDRICEGEQVQTAEFYNRQERTYNRNVAKIYHKNRKTSAAPPTATSTAPPAILDIEPAVQPIAIEGPMEPVRSYEGVNVVRAQNDPYQLREEANTIDAVLPSVAGLLPEDDNFGSHEVDGARDFLQLCTGEELPPMSLRQTMTEEMLRSQFPTLPSIAPIVDNFQEIDLKTINTPMFKRPLGYSTPLPVTNPLVQLHETTLQESEEAHQAPTAEVVSNRANEAASSVQPNSVPPAMPVVESSSSTEEVPVQRPKRTTREVALTHQLERFESTARGMPRPRRNFDIFSFPYRTVWNKTIQDVQNQLAEMYRQPQQTLQEQQDLDEGKPVMREAATNQRLDSGFQQTTDEGFRIPPAMSTTENSNLAADNRTDGMVAIDDPARHVLSRQEAMITSDLVGASMQLIPVEQLESIDGKIMEASDRFQLPMNLDTPAANNETSVMKLPVQVETAKHTVQYDTPLAVPQEQRPKRIPSNKRIETDTISTEKYPNTPSEIGNGHEKDVSSVLFNQAKELETISEQSHAVDEVAPLDTMLIDIIIVVQGEMCKPGENRVSLQHLQEFFHTNSRVGVCKLFKNIILLKQAGQLDVQCNAENHITHVALRLPEVDQAELL